jgi:hypothetical protein
MRARLIALRERRALLVARAQGEREALAGTLRRAEAALAWVERARGVLQDAAHRPLLVFGAVLALAVLRPRRALKLAAAGWSAWRLVRRVQRWWARLASRGPAPAARSMP